MMGPMDTTGVHHRRRSDDIVIGPAAGSRCLHRLARETAESEQVGHAPVDVGVRMRAEAVVERRRREYRRWRSVLGPGVEVVRIDADPPAHRAGIPMAGGDAPGASAVDRTLAALGRGVPVVWDAVLPADPSTGRQSVDCVLVSAPRGGYLPVLVVNHKVVDPRRGPRVPPVTVTGLLPWAPREDAGSRIRRHPEDADRLAHAWWLLRACGHAADRPVGAVLGLGTDLAVVHPLDTALVRNDRSHLSRLEVALGEVDTRPSRIGECRGCPWWHGWTGPAGEVTGCRQELLDRDDVSLVATGAQVEVLRSAGVDTAAELATRSAGRPRGWSGDPYEDTVLRARAWRAGATLVPKVAAPWIRRADVEVDVDLESHLDDGVYLWGTLLTVRDGGAAPTGSREGYRSFETWAPLPSREEGVVFAEFWRWIIATRDEVVGRGRTFAAYCYSRSAEDTWMFSIADRFGPDAVIATVPGVPSRSEVAEFVASPEWVDVHAAVARQSVSTVGTGLKAVAPATGFGWRDPEAGGEASLGWYREVRAGQGVASERARHRLRRYNEDDVRATLAVREWIDRKRLNVT